MKHKIKRIKYSLEIIGIRALLLIFSRISFELASDIGGFIGRKIGPYLRVTKVADNNLKLVMPELTKVERKKIIYGMWDNLGRTAVEFISLGQLRGDNYSKYVEIEGIENFNIIKQRAKENKPSILFSGHYANWEINPKTSAELDCPLVLVYRRANNPFVDKIIQEIRSSYQKDMIQKSSLGIKKIVDLIKQGKVLGMLMDQRVSNGMGVPFMGKEAKMAPAIAKIALKYNCPIFPTQVIRLDNRAKFKIKVFPPIEFVKTQDEDKDTFNILLEINKYLEQFVRENPEQWFWVHNRWKP